MPKLTVKQVQKLQEPGKYLDGSGLYLRIGPTGAKSWILRIAIHGKRRELGLGSADLVSLAEARDSAYEMRRIARAGGDPVSTRKKRGLTLEDAVRRVHRDLAPSWSNPKHAQKWLASLENDVLPALGERQIDTIEAGDVLSVLAPIWVSKNDTAKRLKQRLAKVFDWARSAGHYSGENPVNGLEAALPVVKARPQHMAALAWRDLPGFMGDLRRREGVSARCLEFAILTVVRSGEARGAKWSEISPDGVWTVPAERTKRRVPHRVPLSSEAQAVLEAVRGLNGELVFPSPQQSQRGEPRGLSDVSFSRLLGRMERDGVTTHGFRSTFRDWCSESARVDRAVAEAALHHAYGDKVERAYARSDLFERRRDLMDAWGRFAAGSAGDVLQMVRA
ncbi:tyrosine-type recombinase/integrase [Pseudoruegeria sp. SHC-113]|uniref:tyrosine-type recombinase/integrase n=1 Tax=Pseudoruegeria sp. SHC-113 TaxID=2855439 RepID=UPI0021BA3E35|nr:site-specific integrase [Pseudoruegeria sp. SHC-113]MCT8159995.1 integrase arm-type DNA-binding domain-containing protein [Pseudoruegeria sp. SHC-113]